MIGFIRNLLQGWSDKRNESQMFLTHTPRGFKIGDIVDGRRITNIERVSDTALFNGGSAACYRVAGVKVSASSMFRRVA